MCCLGSCNERYLGSFILKHLSFCVSANTLEAAYSLVSLTHRQPQLPFLDVLMLLLCQGQGHHPVSLLQQSPQIQSCHQLQFWATHICFIFALFWGLITSQAWRKDPDRQVQANIVQIKNYDTAACISSATISPKPTYISFCQISLHKKTLK